MFVWKPSYLKEIYTDAKGKKWIIRDLLLSQIPRRLSHSKVEHLWELNSHRQLWTKGVGSLAQVIASPLLQNSLAKPLELLYEDLCFGNTLEAHTDRIAAIVLSLQNGWLPPPIITVEGKVWDGAHRLCAFKKLSWEHIGVLEFYDFP